MGPERPCPTCGGAMRLDKRLLDAWSPARWPAGERRAKHGVLDLSCLVLDHDDGMPLDEVSALWSSWPHVVHTSWSHTVDHPKCRVVVPFDSPVPASLWPRVWRWAIERDPRADRSCSDASRLFFVPAIRSEDWPFVSVIHDEPSRLLCLVEHALPPAEPARAQRQLAVPIRPRGEDRRLQHALRTDPAARRRLAELLGARVAGEGASARAEDVTCPKCGKPSVWWPIEPQRMHGAACAHRNSCGWRGWLDELAASASVGGA